MIENIFLSLESIWEHKLRSILTMIGIIIGIGSIVAIFSIVEGNTENTKKSMLGGENNSITLMFDTEENLKGGVGSVGKKPTYFEPFNIQKRQEIKAVPNVKNTTFTYDSETDFYYGSKKSNGKIIGITNNYFNYDNYKLVKGRLFTPNEYKEDGQVVVLDESLYKTFYKNNEGLNKLLEIKGIPYRIIGVVKQKSASSPGIYSMEGQVKKAFTSYLNWPKYMGTLNPIPNVMVQTEKADDLQDTAQKVANYLNKSINRKETNCLFGIYKSEDLEKSINNYSSTQFKLLGGIASISLIVGGIGVMNIMLVSVTERTKEIGIKRALGARRKVILQQFLLESISLTMVGGLLGILLGLLSGKIATLILNYPYYISFTSILGSLLFSVAIGLSFGLLPAIKASKLEPVDALRYE
ncbi:ABC transporter permease [Enterococcus gilvus]|uniref:ABC transporter permease n=1 Tax=Enterococcus gilvus TaxID=160453 RepID=UPI003EDA1E5E